MKGAPRDPLSAKYDVTARRNLEAAVEAHSERRGVQVWVASPPAEFRDVDRGGRTRHERAFTRCCYWQVREVPLHHGQPVFWSLKLTWGPISKRGGRWGRVVTMRLFRAYAGRRHSLSRPAEESYSQNAAIRSGVDDRVDHASL